MFGTAIACRSVSACVCRHVETYDTRCGLAFLHMEGALNLAINRCVLSYSTLESLHSTVDTLDPSLCGWTARTHARTLACSHWCTHHQCALWRAYNFDCIDRHLLVVQCPSVGRFLVVVNGLLHSWLFKRLLRHARVYVMHACVQFYRLPPYLECREITILLFWLAMSCQSYFCRLKIRMPLAVSLQEYTYFRCMPAYKGSGRLCTM